MARSTWQLVLASLAVAAADPSPCCKSCELPKVKVFSTDAKHGYCGEACMDPKNFNLFHKFEANLTIATEEHPCSKQWTPLNDKQYTDYFDTVTHGLGPISCTLDLYAPTDMPKHACCNAPLIPAIGCPGFLHKPTSVLIDGTGPFCCPEGATPTQPCGNQSLPVLSSDSPVIV
ncbi:Gstm5 [Symbiodinium sp. CCMP2592]|nr:Gstm5 [Symbiodinium sp. CCMP2592]